MQVCASFLWRCRIRPGMEEEPRTPSWRQVTTLQHRRELCQLWLDAALWKPGRLSKGSVKQKHGGKMEGGK
ncbi:hypothetical protein C8263_16935 [Deinococcus arcticus]|uniref:Uncharacterized protein n=1 Tax=Deinococcus arcticus TaxID=2136176 RepID=A0A2T3W3Y1_9DEIO|nr:hypothetical protein C8263_16935 [Deinococcus arcticus]